jgi:hypothetical protein
LGYQASLPWISRRQVALAGILAEDAEAAVREVVSLWAGLLVEEGQREAEHEVLRWAALEPMWRRELKHLREPGHQLELPLLTEEVLSAE